MTIDVFSHVLPLKYLAALQAMVDVGKIPRFSDFFMESYAFRAYPTWTSGFPSWIATLK